MESIARALVFAVTYLSTREDDADDEQDDVKALESIAGFLAEATDGEKDALAAAADLAHREMVERHQHQVRPDVVSDYESWMENMFVEGWEGNRRIP
jgi:hypothetical protein